MTKSITQLGKEYGIENPYENYGKLVAACLEAAKKRKGFSWNIWIDPEEIILIPRFVPVLKESEKHLDGIAFEGSSNLGKSSSDIRERSDILVETCAQFLDFYARGEDVLRQVPYQWIDFAWEDIAGRVPGACFGRDGGNAGLGGSAPGDRNVRCGVRSAVRGWDSVLVPSFFLSPSDITVEIAGKKYRLEEIIEQA